MEKGYSDEWWQSKLLPDTSVQWKHLAALAMLSENSFPMVDLGAGRGVFIQAVSQKFPGLPVSGVEMSRVAIENSVCKAAIEEASILEWRPMQTRVRTACMIDVIEHLSDPVQVLRHVADYADEILIACPNFNFLRARIDVALGKVPFQNKPARGGHVYWCQYDGIKSLFADCGLAICAERHIYPKNENVLASAIGRLRPSLLAHEFVFLLTNKRCK